MNSLHHIASQTCIYTSPLVIDAINTIYIYYCILAEEALPQQQILRVPSKSSESVTVPGHDGRQGQAHGLLLMMS